MYKNISFNFFLPHIPPPTLHLPYLSHKKGYLSYRPSVLSAKLNIRSSEVKHNTYKILGVCLENYIGQQLFYCQDSVRKPSLSEMEERNEFLKELFTCWVD